MSVPHDPASCARCERVSAGVWQRHWMGVHKGPWHLIQEGPDLMLHVPAAAHYVTVLAYQPDAEGKPASYRGPLYYELGHDDPAVAFAELRTGLEVLQVEYDLPLEAVRICHSGGRGPHVTIPAAVLGAVGGHPRLPHIYRMIVESLFPPAIAPSLDRGVYNRGRGGCGVWWPAERAVAEQHVGLRRCVRRRLQATGLTGSLRSMPAARVSPVRTISASEVKSWR